MVTDVSYSFVAEGVAKGPYFGDDGGWGGGCGAHISVQIVLK